MAFGHGQVTAVGPTRGWRRVGPGAAAAGLCGGLGALALAALIAAGGGVDPAGLWADPYVRGVTLFTILQATLSMVLAAVLGVMAARALHRRAGPGAERLTVMLASLALVCPTVVAAVGIVAVWGRAGIVADTLGAVGIAWPGAELYGLPGILVAHVFFNAPLMARIFYNAIRAVPDPRWRQAAMLGFGPWQVWRHIEWPEILRVLPGAAGLVFLLCFTSFALVLMLGGGPAASTLEVAIYEAARLDFDLECAATLSLWQLLLCAGVLVLLAMAPVDWTAAKGAGARGGQIRPDRDRLGARLTDGLTVAIGLGLVGLPLAMVVSRGVGPQLLRTVTEPAFQAALQVSLGLALAASVLTVLMALAIGEARRTLALPQRLARPRWTAALDLGATVGLALPSIVLGLGAFLLLRGVANIFAIAPALVLAANVTLALPFALRALQGRMAVSAVRHDRLCAHLGVQGWWRWRWVELPFLRRELGFAAAVSAALSVGDLGVIALFGSEGFRTLPWLLYQTAGRYDAAGAAAIAALLLALSLGLFLGIERAVGGWRAAD